MRKVIYVINASSRADTGITENIARSLSWMRHDGLPDIACVTLADGPCGINSARDSDDAAPAVLRFIEREAARDETAGFVVACFSDPGVYAARGLTGKPVAGIGEAGLSAALCLGDRIGTIGASANGAKTLRLARQLGMLPRLAGHQGLGLDYGQLQDARLVTQAVIDAGRRLKEDAGAEALLFAGAGFAAYASLLETAVGLPVIDPVQAAAGLVLSQIMQRSCG